VECRRPASRIPSGARGIERREIFKDDTDRRSFLDRLAVILEETKRPDVRSQKSEVGDLANAD